MRSNRGFTLIEVMIVLAILAGIMALGAPRLFKKKRQHQISSSKNHGSSERN